jgi:hypothetical protein
MNGTGDVRVVWGQLPLHSGKSGACLAGWWRHIVHVVAWAWYLAFVWLASHPPRGFKAISERRNVCRSPREVRIIVARFEPNLQYVDKF